MTAPCTFLPWDSDFFGHRIARVNDSRLTPESIAAIRDWSARESIDCLYFLAESDDALTVRLAEDHHFRLQDIRLTFRLERPVRLPELLPSRFVIRPSRPDDLIPLQSTAQQSYIHSRFYNDPRFTPEQCAALYDRWLTRSLTESGYAAVTWVAEIDSQAAGYVVCHRDADGKNGSIGLVGVTEAARGQSVGQALIQAAIHDFWQQGMTAVEVVTQGRNLAAQRLYQRSGFLIRSVMLWYHQWSNELASSHNANSG